MKYNSRDKAVLMLEDGSVFEGRSVGKKGFVTGEICFNTGMTGYQEIFTDPSYYGQIILMTASHIGNYGTTPEEVESDSVKIAGLVTKKFSDQYFSRVNADKGIQEYFEDNERVGISDVDTREIVRHIRSKGAMNAIIDSTGKSEAELKEILAKVPSMSGLELSSKVSCESAYEYNDEGQYKVAVLDLGVKKNILRCLAERGCKLKVFPWDTSADEILAWNPDGIMLSNGPGDPSAMPKVVEQVKALVASKLPIFGICLGHQVLALSQGMNTFKMHNGHRGCNHPVKNLESGKGEITSQNHGFVVDLETAKDMENIVVTHQHLNDGTLAGFRLKGEPVFSVQYHPESSAGPNDSRYLFDQFVDNIKTYVDTKKLEVS